MLSPHPSGFRGPSSPEQFKTHCVDGALAVSVENTRKGKRVTKLTLQKAKAKKSLCIRLDGRDRATWLAEKAIRERDRAEAQVETASKELADKTKEEEQAALVLDCQGTATRGAFVTLLASSNINAMP